MPDAMVVESAPAGGSYRRLVLARQDEGAQQAMLRAYRAPGQYVLLSTLDAEEPNYFGVSRSPRECTRGLEFLIKPQGPVAGRLAQLKTGQQVRMSDPIGDGFALQRARGRDVLLLAAGSGIGPLRAVLDAVCEERSEYGWIRLYYGQSRAQDFAYPDWLDDLGRRSVELERVVSRPQEGYSGPVGYVQEVADRPENVARIGRLALVLCGMPEMQQDARSRFMSRGVSPEYILTNL